MSQSINAIRKAARSYHLSQAIRIAASPQAVFDHVDDIHNTGWHMEKSSMPMMGSRMNVEVLSKNRTGLGATYRWTGKVLGMTLDFTETVVKWVKNKERVWRTIGDAKIIIMANYEMAFLIKPVDAGSELTVQIRYELPRDLFGRLLGLLLANWYSKWCLANMTNDAKAALEMVNSTAE
jgi:hypothetical protein